MDAKSPHAASSTAHRRGLLRWLVPMALLSGLACGQAQAQGESAFPVRPVKLVVTFPPGGAGDLTGRAVAKGLQALWGQTVVVENAAGASGAIGAEAVARAPADGHTLLLGTAGPITVLPFLRDKMPYDPLTDLQAIANTVNIPNVLVVNSKLPYKTLADFLAAARARPGALDYASSGRGESHHMMMEHMMRVTGVKLNEIPYKGGAPAALAVASGDVQASWLAISTAQPMLRSGQLVALAVSTKDRVAQLPDVPTMAEQGFPAYDYSNWMGIMGPARMPPALVRRIESDLQKVVATQEFSEAVAKMGSVARFESTEQFTRAIRESHARHKAMLAP